jgi:hypothetical protein
MIEYLAIPYTNSDPKIMEYRFEMVNRIAAKFIRDGRNVYSPISHNHLIVPFGVPKDWEFWGKFDREFLEICGKMIVVMADGWEYSRGIKEEIAIFKELGKGDNIEYFDPIEFI